MKLILLTYLSIQGNYQKICKNFWAYIEGKCTRFKRDIEEKEKLIHRLNNEKASAIQEIEITVIPTTTKDDILNELGNLLENYNNISRTRILKKLNFIYGSKGTFYRGIFLPQNTDCFLNLSQYNLSNNEKDFLNLGLNYHVQPKYCQLEKEAELESLYSKLLNLQDRNLITVNPRLCDLLTAESTKHRNPKYNPSIPKHLREAAKSLKDNNDVVIRRADKAQIYVLLDRKEYIEKENTI